MRRILLDTSSLMYRAFFALPSSITDGKGQPINAVHGYLDMGSRLIRTREPGDVVHFYDHDWRPAPRVAAFGGYKATRAVDPEGLPEQFDILREMLDAMGMPQAWAPGWEAEDAIGTMCARSGKSERLEIVTGDRDLIQLVRDPVVKVLFTRKGVSEIDVMDEAAVKEKYGIPADRYAEFATLRGDPSDELPGVKGVGEKTARQLILEYPSLGAMVEDALADRRTGASLKRSPALRARIRDAADYLASMRDVVPIRTDLDVELRRPAGDPKRMDKLAERYRLTGPVRRYREAVAEVAG